VVRGDNKFVEKINI